MAIKDFVIGNTLKYNLTFTKASDGTPIDVSGWEIYVSFKTDSSDPDNLAIIQKSFTLPSDANSIAGTASIIIPTTDTDNFVEGGTYFYGFKRVIPGSPPDVKTLETGLVKVSRGASNITVPTAFIPDVTDVVLATAQSTLTTTGFVAGTVTSEASTATPPIASGNVIRTNPAAGDYIALGTTVDIVTAL